MPKRSRSLRGFARTQGKSGSISAFPGYGPQSILGGIGRRAGFDGVIGAAAAALHFHDGRRHMPSGQRVNPSGAQGARYVVENGEVVSEGTLL